MTGTVLVVDNHELVRAVVSLFLARNGYSVAAAGTDAQAVDALSWHQPAVVIANVEMLTDDGVLVDRLRRGNPNVPVVLMADSRREWPIAGVPCLVKPFNVGLLLDTVVKLVGAPAFAVGD